MTSMGRLIASVNRIAVAFRDSPPSCAPKHSLLRIWAAIPDPPPYFRSQNSDLGFGQFLLRKGKAADGALMANQACIKTLDNHSAK